MINFLITCIGTATSLGFIFFITFYFAFGRFPSYIKEFIISVSLPSMNPVFLVSSAGGLSAWERAARHVVPEPTVPGTT